MLSSYTRLLELAGQKSMLREMSYADAQRIFTFHGVDPRGLDAAALKAAHRTLLLTNHPDKGGDVKAMQEINAAFDVLKASPSGSSRAGPGQRGGFGTNPRHDADQWARGKADAEARRAKSRTGEPDFTRLDDIKAYFDANLKPGHRAWTISGFDGTFMRHSFTVRATPEQFPELAKAMVVWQTKGANNYPCRAVMAQTRADEPKVRVIWACGHDLDPPMVFEHDSFNQNFSNDQSLMRRLPEMIDAFLSEHGHAQA